MSHLSQISRNSTHFTKLNVKTSGLIIMHQTVNVSLEKIKFRLIYQSKIFCLMIQSLLNILQCYFHLLFQINSVIANLRRSASATSAPGIVIVIFDVDETILCFRTNG